MHLVCIDVLNYFFPTILWQFITTTLKEWSETESLWKLLLYDLYGVRLVRSGVKGDSQLLEEMSMADEWLTGTFDVVCWLCSLDGAVVPVWLWLCIWIFAEQAHGTNLESVTLP